MFESCMWCCSTDYQVSLQTGHTHDRRVLAQCQTPDVRGVPNSLSHPQHCCLQDVLAICGNTLPSWCSQLVFSCKFLFPFDLRRRYFYCTAFGLARALHHLQQLQNAEGGSTAHTDREVRELRVGRLTRQKVPLPLTLAALSGSVFAAFV